MSKEKRVYLVFLFVIVVVVIAALLIRRQATTNEDITPILETIKISTKEAVLFEDESGFSFKYYNDLTVADITPDDDEHYSLLSVINNDKKELVRIKLADTKYKKLNDWLKSWEKEASVTAKLSGATALDNIAASNYSTENQLFTAAIDHDVLYLIETMNQELETKKLFELIIQSFKLDLPESRSPESGTIDTTIYESEEVIE